ncbi:MAG: hypothetical protein EA425_03520 [Puniceicoccaceae bacterium]|nr:MAG: hypothetical protein EA425_03520 [Puniceicoccaceae bacterium]
MRPVVLCPTEEAAFRRRFLEGLERREPLVLAAAGWGSLEWGRMRAWLGDEVILEGVDRASWVAGESQTAFGGKAPVNGEILIPTGGSGGGLRFARHTRETLEAACRAFAEHWGGGAVDAVGVLPLHHVSGLLAWLRCEWTGGAFLPTSSLEDALDAAHGGRFLSLVPTQLVRLLEAGESDAAMRRWRAVFVGGGPGSPALWRRARQRGWPLAPTYGATETAAMVAVSAPEDFLGGDDRCGRALPGVRLTVPSASEGGEGLLSVECPSLFLGYAGPGLAAVDRPVGPWQTRDRARLDPDGGLAILGRADAAILTGGEKVYPEDVENLLVETGIAGEAIVCGVPDAEWGERLAAVYRPGPNDGAGRREYLRKRAAPHAVPAIWIPVPELPRTPVGKPDRAKARRLAERAGSAPGSEGTAT